MPRKRKPISARYAPLLDNINCCRRCKVSEATFSFVSKIPLFCEPCKSDVAAGWSEFWLPAHRERTFADYQRKYGIGPAEYGLLYERQGGCCLICRRFDRPLVVDHCHDSGLVRGLLCSQCNSAIGLLGESIEVIGRAIEYVAMAESIRRAHARSLPPTLV